VFNAMDAAAGLRWVADRPSVAAQALGSITGSMGFETREAIVPVLRSHGYAESFGRAPPHDGARAQTARPTQ
jgi:cytochrome c peroxidase